MSKVTINGFLIYEKTVWKDQPNIIFYTGTAANVPCSSEYANRAVICEHSIEVEIPDSFDPTPGFIAELEEQKRQMRLKFAAELADIDNRISKLQALPFVEA